MFCEGYFEISQFRLTVDFPSDRFFLKDVRSGMQANLRRQFLPAQTFFEKVKKLFVFVQKITDSNKTIVKIVDYEMFSHLFGHVLGGCAGLVVLPSWLHLWFPTRCARPAPNLVFYGRLQQNARLR